MKLFVTSVLAGLLISLSGFACAGTLVFSDSFENNVVDTYPEGWTVRWAEEHAPGIGPRTVKSGDPAALEGDLLVRLVDETVGRTAGMVRSFDPMTRGRAVVNVYFPREDGGSLSVEIRQQGGRVGGTWFRRGTIQYRNAEWVLQTSIASYPSGQWFQVMIEWDAEKRVWYGYSVLEGKATSFTPSEGVPFAPDATVPDQLEIRVGSNSGGTRQVAFVDDVSIYRLDSTPVGLVTPSGGSPVDPKVAAAMEKSYRPIDISLFKDSINHWHNERGESRGRTDPRYRTDQIVHIAENLLDFQNPDGGWATNVDWLLNLEPSEIRRIRGNPINYSTFDNRNIYPQIRYLALVYQATGLDRYRAAAERGLGYILTEQRPSGGWQGQAADAIGYNDEVMTGIMKLLRYIVWENAPEFDWVGAELRGRLGNALDKALAVMLKTQVVVDDVKTGWGQQHDHRTLQPVAARTYELASLSPDATTWIVDFLIEIKNPSPEVVEAVESAIAWLKDVRIFGTRVQEIRLDTPIVYEKHVARTDRVVVEDPSARPIWTRYYEIGTNRPFFANRDGTKVYSLAEVHHERRTGHSWYGYWPEKTINEKYPAWKKRTVSL